MSKESEKIFESKTILSGIINTAEDAIISVDYNQNIILFNQGAEKIFCYSAEEIIGKNLGMLLPESIRSDHSEHINNFGKSEIVSMGMKERSEITLRGFDESIFYAS